MARLAGKGRKNNPGSGQGRSRSRSRSAEPSGDAIKAAEDVALAAFASGLRLAAAFGTVAAKTTSLALASLARGADTFSELVKKEALSTSSSRSSPRNRSNRRKSLDKKPLRR